MSNRLRRNVFKNPFRTPGRVCLVASAGGHLTELLLVRRAFEDLDLVVATYYGPRLGDVRSLGRVYVQPNIGKKPMQMAWAFVFAAFVLVRERPSVVLSTGSEIAIPYFAVALLLGIRRVFVETFTRVEAPSFTGRWLYHLSDAFFVQWRGLLRSYGSKARYEGPVI